MEEHRLREMERNLGFEETVRDEGSCDYLRHGETPGGPFCALIEYERRQVYMSWGRFATQVLLTQPLLC